MIVTMLCSHTESHIFFDMKWRNAFTSMSMWLCMCTPMPSGSVHSEAMAHIVWLRVAKKVGTSFVHAKINSFVHAVSYSPLDARCLSWLLHLTSSHLTSSYLASSHLTSSHLAFSKSYIFRSYIFTSGTFRSYIFRSYAFISYVFTVKLTSSHLHTLCLCTCCLRIFQLLIATISLCFARVMCCDGRLHACISTEAVSAAMGTRKAGLKYWYIYIYI